MKRKHPSILFVFWSGHFFTINININNRNNNNNNSTYLEPLANNIFSSVNRMDLEMKK